MRFAERDLKKFQLFKPCFVPDGDGDVSVVYGAPPSAEFFGSIQPAGESGGQRGFGLDVKYTFYVYTPEDAGFRELDIISDEMSRYKVRNVKRWNTYFRLMVEQTEEGGGAGV